MALAVNQTAVPGRPSEIEDGLGGCAVIVCLQPDLDPMQARDVLAAFYDQKLTVPA